MGGGCGEEEEEEEEEEEDDEDDEDEDEEEEFANDDIVLCWFNEKDIYTKRSWYLDGMMAAK